LVNSVSYMLFVELGGRIYTWSLQLKHAVKLLNNKKDCTFFAFVYNAITTNRLIELLKFGCADI
ncbi:TPA: hypothetical protein ACIVT8_004428, partial [Salmonella enterica subsp. enterica serovar Mgulani]